MMLMIAVVSIFNWLITWNEAASMYDKATNERLFCIVKRPPGTDILKKSFGFWKTSVLNCLRNSSNEPFQLEMYLLLYKVKLYSTWFKLQNYPIDCILLNCIQEILQFPNRVWQLMSNSEAFLYYSFFARRKSFANILLTIPCSHFEESKQIGKSTCKPFP